MPEERQRLIHEHELGLFVFSGVKMDLPIETTRYGETEADAEDETKPVLWTCKGVAHFDFTGVNVGLPLHGFCANYKVGLQNKVRKLSIAEIEARTGSDGKVHFQINSADMRTSRGKVEETVDQKLASIETLGNLNALTPEQVAMLKSIAAKL